jgi:4-amino-4-deoxy-L-arabinose transferase-like glycosyltransferase
MSKSFMTIKKKANRNRDTKNYAISIYVNGSARFSFLKNNFAPLLVFAISLLVNLSVLAGYIHSPFAQIPEWDAEIYWKWAKAIASGNEIGDSIFHQPPLYPYFLSLIIFIFGPSFLPIFIVQAVLSASSSSLIYIIASRITNKKFALTAGLAYAFYGLQVFYSMKILSECLSVTLMLLTSYLLLTANSRKHSIFIGVVLGLLIISKPIFILAVPFLIFHLYHNKFTASEHLLKNIFAFCVPLIVIIGSVTLRNYYVGKDLVLVSSNGGENFFIGNNSEANGVYNPIKGISRDIKYQNEDVNAFAQTETGKIMKRSEVSRYWFHKGLRYIFSDPLSSIKLELKKIKYLLSGVERSSMYYLSFERAKITRLFIMPFVNFYIVFPFFIVGIISSFYKPKNLTTLYLFLFINIGNILFFFYDTRFMQLLMPYEFIFASLGARKIVTEIQFKKLSKLPSSPAFLILLMSALFCGFIYFRDSKEKKPDWHLYMVLGDIFYQKSEYSSAIDAYMKSSSLKKNDWMPVLGACKVYFAMRKKDVALQLYNEAFPNLSDDFKKLIARDADFDSLRNYAKMKKPSLP